MFGLPPISLSAAGLVDARIPASADTRSIFDLVRTLGFRGITLDTSAAGFRARELSRSARRDVSATMRRRELSFVGLDLWIPPEHFSDPANSQRAIEAVMGACELSGELCRLNQQGGDHLARATVSVVLPDSMEAGDKDAMHAHAQRVGATLADHQLSWLDHTQAEQQDSQQSDQQDAHDCSIGIGIDPAMVLMNGTGSGRPAISPGKAITLASDRLVSVRLSDANSMGRCPIASEGSRLDLPSYLGSLLVASRDWVILDVRGVSDSVQAAGVGRDVWTGSGG